ncbi:MAG: ABC transporter substrate-binding protein [Anaerolineae bacterium]|nr:ABC transporter substrate-binding protein [Anaerolineae bacterium]
MATTTRKRFLITFISITLVLLIGLLLFPGSVFERPDPPLTELLPHGELRIGVDASNPPFALATADDFSGFEIDIGRAIAEELQVPVRFVNMTFDGLYDSLRADQVDILIATLSVDPLRTGQVLYTRDYFNAGLMLVSTSANPIESMEAMPGHILAYEFGSTADTEIRHWLRRILPFTANAYERPQYALDAVRLGDADAALVEAPAAWLYFRQHREWPAHVEYVTYLPYVIATRIDRPQLWQVIDNTLQTMTENGTLNDIQNEWF